jgi:predicted NUDIX family phosphoesterase
MVVATEKLRPFFTETLIRHDTEAILELMAREHTFIERAVAEVSEEWRQIIPYVVIRHADEVFVLERTSKQTEARLHHKLSIGIGGHINPGHDLHAGLKKELEEEVHVADAYALTFAGILNDESTEVGRVHLGAVFLLDASTPSVTVLETEKMRGSWRARTALAEARGAMETWSQIVYDELLA